MNERLITFHPSNKQEDTVFSILIPTWNNLAYLKCCVESIRKNASLRHEIVIHINDGSDGSLEWVKEQGFSYSHSKVNVGVCYAFNAASAMATSPLLLLTDDDKYFCPGWDQPLKEEADRLDHPYFCINATAIEHTSSNNQCVIAPYDFGKDIETFDEQKLLGAYASLPFHDWTGGNWYPMLLNRQVWTLIGGLSIEFSPGMWSDPDMMVKLWDAGVRYYKGVSKSRVYHFMSKSVSRVKKNDGYSQFLQKWGMTTSTFFRYYLQTGKEFKGALKDPGVSTAMRRKKMRDRLKRLYSFFKH